MLSEEQTIFYHESILCRFAIFVWIKNMVENEVDNQYLRGFFTCIPQQRLSRTLTESVTQFLKNWFSLLSFSLFYLNIYYISIYLYIIYSGKINEIILIIQNQIQLCDTLILICYKNILILLQLRLFLFFVGQFLYLPRQKLVQYIYQKIQSLKEKIAKLQRELQSQFDTAAAVMRKFKETKKKHDDKKITQKTNNAEAQSENEKKKTEVSQKAEPTKNIEEKAPTVTKRSLRTLRSRKRNSPQSKSHKIKRPLKCPNRTQSLLKRKLRKRKRINNLSQKSQSNHSQKLVQMNKKRLLTQNRKPSQAQRKPRRRSSKQNIRNSLSNNRELRKISAKLTLGNSLSTTGYIPNPNQVNETMHQRQPPPSNANTTEQPLVQTEGNNEPIETEKREPVSGNQVSESGKTGPLTTP
ncbi:Hypothetical_protein [Hexamita inflata]|uniref:Hypothetical_protein n=1 Tax=Hexamita inflata TaxID=28002 RepID=A0AA86UIK5_9EUKA|nr:Hypothetical protein HINF_LOCUS29028 [Hexamita inflata]